MKKPNKRTSKATTPKPTISSKSKRSIVDPLDYDHPYDSMRRFAELLTLRYSSPNTRHCYYRSMRVVHEFHSADPESLNENHLRDYFLYSIREKKWKPRTLRQATAAGKLFYATLLDHQDWRVFDQIRTKDFDTKPVIPSRME